jgi:hypothetical protein
MSKFIYGWNVPGYLPEMEPLEADSFDAAKAGLIFEIKVTQEHAEEREEPPHYGLGYAAAMIEAWDVDQLRGNAPHGIHEEVGVRATGGELAVMVPFDNVYWIREE